MMQKKRRTLSIPCNILLVRILAEEDFRKEMANYRPLEREDVASLRLGNIPVRLMLQPAPPNATSPDQVQVSWPSATISKLEALLTIVEKRKRISNLLCSVQCLSVVIVGVRTCT